MKQHQFENIAGWLANIATKLGKIERLLEEQRKERRPARIRQQTGRDE